MSTTTTETGEPDEKRDIPLLHHVRVGDINIPTGYPPKQSGETKDPTRFFGYVGAVPKHRTPTSPGEMLLEEFLKPLGVSQRQLADAIHLPYRQINQIVNGRRPVTPAIALRLTRYIGMSVGFCMNLQLAWDLYHASQAEAETLSKIEPLPRPDMPELLKLAGLDENEVG